MEPVVRRRAVRLAPGAADCDRRFQRLLVPADWERLPAPVRRRFSRHLDATAAAIYAGEVAATRLSIAGRVFAQLARLIGAPLPLAASGRVAACVAVIEDPSAGGQRWTRLYARPGRTAQVVHSTKRFAGPTGLEECVGGGVGMRLRLSVEDRSLVFRSAGYFWRLGSRGFDIPAWLSPGTLEVRHREEREGRFSFVLTLTHPWFGVVIEQTAFFEDCSARAAKP
jgi:uncharacterized protein DUF4166